MSARCPLIKKVSALFFLFCFFATFVIVRIEGQSVVQGQTFASFFTAVNPLVDVWVQVCQLSPVTLISYVRFDLNLVFRKQVSTNYFNSVPVRHFNVSFALSAPI